MLGHDDKRAFFRMILNSPCELRIRGDDSGATISAICKDISAVGMSLELSEPVSIGTEMDVAIESSNSQFSSLSALVKVVRAFEQDEGNQVVGVEIIKMN